LEKPDIVATIPEKSVPLAPIGRSPSDIRTSFAGNLAWRALANWSTQLISWAGFLILVRLLAPSDFGIVSMCVVLYAQLRFVSDFGIPTTVVTLRSMSEDDIAQLNTVGLLFGLGTFAVGCLLAWPAAVFFKTPRLFPVIIVTSVALIAQGLRSVPEGLLNKEMRFKVISLLDAVRDITSAIVTVILALLGFGYWALVLGNLVAVLIRTTAIIAIRHHRFAWPRFECVRKPLAFSWHVLAYVFSWSTYSSLDNVTAGRVLGQSALGLYGMAWTVANMPLEKVVSLVTTIVPSYLASVQKDPVALRRYLFNLTEALSLITFPATIGLALVAREAVPFVLGHKWDGVIRPLEVLCAYAALRSVVALLPKLLTAVGNARFVMRIETSALVLMPTAFYIGSHWGTTGIAFGWVAAYPLVVIPLYWKALKSIGMSVAEYFKALRPGLDGAMAMAVGVGLVKYLLPSSLSLWMHLIAEISAGAAIYFGTVLLLHMQRVSALLRTLKQMRRSKIS
jgi:PST family polysaccharide transporter